MAAGLEQPRRGVSGRHPDCRRRPRRLGLHGAGLLLVALTLSACASRTVPPAPTVVTPRFPDYLYPAVPAELAADRADEDHARAWAFLQTGDLRTAERGFLQILKRAPAFYPADAALGYVDLSQSEYERAIDRFDRALSRSPQYLSALVGKGEALLAARRAGEALGAFEAALAANGELDSVRRRVDLLRFRVVQEQMDAAREATRAGQYEAARAAYQQALSAAPESTLIWRELARLEQERGDLDAALEDARRAAGLDATDARSLVLVGEIHVARGEVPEAIDAYTSAYTLEPTDDVAARLASLREKTEAAAWPPQFTAIAGKRTLARADLAALVGVKLDDVIRTAESRLAVVITDTRGHWADRWILAVTGAGLMEVYPNHTFQPEAGVRRGDLAEVVSRILAVLESRDPVLGRAWQGVRREFADLGPSHLSYAAVSRASAAGVLPVLEGNTFQLNRSVSGSEALEIVDRLEALVRRARLDHR